MQQALQTIIQNIGQHVPQSEQQQFQQWCQAGQQILFDPKFHANMTLVKDPASRQNPVPTIAKGTAGLIWMMYKQAGSPKLDTPLVQVMGFSAIVLMCHAIDFAEQSLKIPFTPEMISECTKWLVQHLFEHAGITPEMLQNEINKGAQGQPAPQSAPQSAPQGNSGMLAGAK